jgi:hypothetical protein
VEEVAFVSLVFNVLMDGALNDLKCIRQFVESVIRLVKYHLNQMVSVQSIVVTVSAL